MLKKAVRINKISCTSCTKGSARHKSDTRPKTGESNRDAKANDIKRNTVLGLLIATIWALAVSCISFNEYAIAASKNTTATTSSEESIADKDFQ